MPVFLLACCLIPEGGLSGQSEIQVDYEGELYPMYEYRFDTPYVMVDGKMRKATDEKRIIQDVDSYGDGKITVTVTKKEIKQIDDVDPKKIGREIMFDYEAELVADRDLKKCFGVLPVVSSGSPILYFTTIGNIQEGSTKKVKIDSYDAVHGVGTLHVFSGGKEISRDPVVKYTINEEFKNLKKTSEGVSVLELSDTEPFYPHLLSEDGKIVLTFRDRETHLSLIVYDLASNSIIKDIEIEGYASWIRDLEWLNDKEAVFVLWERKLDGFVDKTLYSYRLGDNKVELLRKHVRRIAISDLKVPDTIIVVSSDYDYYPLNCKTNESGKDKQMGIGRNYFDWDANPRILERVQNKKVTYKYRDSGRGAWKRLDDLNQEPGFSFDFRADDELEQQVFFQRFSPDNEKIYIYTNHRSGKFELALYNLETGLIERRLFASENYDLGGMGSDNAYILYERDGTEPIGLIWQAQMPIVTWFRDSFKKHQATIDAVFPKSVNIPLDWTADGSVIIYRTYSDQNPGKVVVFMTEKRELLPIYDLAPHLDDDEMGNTVMYSFKARDGYPLDAYLTLPPAYQSGRLPLLVMPHGGPTARDIWGFDPVVQYFATRGYGVLQINYRGSSGYGIEHMKQGLEGELGGVIIDDIADGVKYVIAQGVADPERIAISGSSFGGYCTYMSLIRYPELYKVGVAIAAISHWGKMVRYEWKTDDDYTFAFWNEILGRSSDDDYLAKISPYFRADEITRPIKIIHGDDDGIVPVSQAKIMEKALKDAGKEVELSIYNHVGHSVFRGLYTKNVFGTIRRLEEVDAFIQEHF